jgi:pimeloyl-ACP methyl ester carboxylesterase
MSRIMLSWRQCLAVGGLLAVLAGCDTPAELPDAPAAPAAAEPELAEAARAVTDASTLTRPLRSGPWHIEGALRNGALYAIQVPEDWNGSLVLYAHGFIDAALPIALPVADGWEAFRDRLVADGYAVAYSSFSSNGFALEEGTRETALLDPIVRLRTGLHPRRTFVIGHSLGGLIALRLAEQLPWAYAGALPMCGLVGGSQAAVDYVANVRVLFDFFYPGVLPGTIADIPPGVDLPTQVIGPVVQAVTVNPTGAGAIAQVSQAPLPYASGPQLVESLVRAIGFGYRGVEDLLGRTDGAFPFDNRTVMYTGALPASVLGAINGVVQRYDADPAGVSYLKQYYEPTGRLRVPVVTLHNALDPVAPMFHEQRLLAAATARGTTGLLRQRTVNAYGHCIFTTEEMAGAFGELADWARARRGHLVATP